MKASHLLSIVFLALSPLAHAVVTTDSTLVNRQDIYAASDPSEAESMVGEVVGTVQTIWTNTADNTGRHPDRWLSPDLAVGEDHYWFSKDVPGIKPQAGVLNLTTISESSSTCPVGFAEVNTSAVSSYRSPLSKDENYFHYYYTPAQWTTIFNNKRAFYHDELWGLWEAKRNIEYDRIYTHWQGQLTVQENIRNVHINTITNETSLYNAARNRRDNVCPNLTRQELIPCHHQELVCGIFGVNGSGVPDLSNCIQPVAEWTVMACVAGFVTVPETAAVKAICTATEQGNMNTAISNIATATTNRDIAIAAIAALTPLTTEANSHRGTASNYRVNDGVTVPSGNVLGVNGRNEKYSNPLDVNDTTDIDITGSNTEIPGVPALAADYNVLPITKVLNPFYEDATQRIIGINYRVDLNTDFVSGQAIPIFTYVERYKCVYLGNIGFDVQDAIAGLDGGNGIPESLLNDVFSVKSVVADKAINQQDSVSVFRPNVATTRAADDYFEGTLASASNKFEFVYSLEGRSRCNAATLGAAVNGMSFDDTQGISLVNDPFGKLKNTHEMEGSSLINSGCYYGFVDAEGVSNIDPAKSCRRPAVLTPEETVNFNRYGCGCPGGGLPTVMERSTVYFQQAADAEGQGDVDDGLVLSSQFTPITNLVDSVEGWMDGSSSRQGQNAADPTIHTPLPAAIDEWGHRYESGSFAYLSSEVTETLQCF